MRKIDLTGRRFGRLVVIREGGRANNGQLLWLCQCDCGRVKEVLGASLKSGNTRSCSCSTGRFVDMEIGSRYGRLTIVSRSSNKKGYSAWLCRCDCGNEVTVRGQCVRSGNTTSCGCYHKERNRESNSLPYGISGRNKAIANTKANASRRGIPWDITDDQVIVLMQQHCCYCGAEPAHTSRGRNGSYTYNGLDRVDNTKGYTAGNVVACCNVCNTAKSDLPLNDFIAWVTRVYIHLVVENGSTGG